MEAGSQHATCWQIAAGISLVGGNEEDRFFYHLSFFPVPLFFLPVISASVFATAS